MGILDEARALMAVMQPLTGDRAAGIATVKATGPDVLLPPGNYAVPILEGALRHDMMVKVAVNPANQGGWPVTAAGSAVGIMSNVGGAMMNQREGTALRWWPAFEGIEAKSVVATGGLVGGTDATGLTAVKQIALFEQLRPNLQGGPQDLFKGMLSRFPGVLVTWEASGPGDNQTISPLAQQGSRTGRGKTIQKQEWNVFIVTSRQDGDEARREEGLALVDAVSDFIGERQFVDGISFSSPAGAFIKSRSRWLISPAFYVYRIEVTTTGSRKMLDGRHYNPWTETKLDMETMDAEPFPMVVNNKFPMPQ